MEGLEQELKGLETKLVGKSKEQAENLIKEFKTANDEAIKTAVAEGVKGAEDAFELKLKDIQSQTDEMDKKMQEKTAQMEVKGDFLVDAIKENGEAIVKAKNNSSVNIEVKVVGDMSTANLTGDEPRDYNFDIVAFPAQKVNVSDLVGSVNIGGGTYTYTRETGAEGSIGAATEGLSKNQIDYDFATVDVATNFIAGFARYSKKMRNNLSYITSSIPSMLRRDYFKSENSIFNGILEADATASTEIITGKNKAQMLMNEIAKLEDADYDTNGIVVRPSDYMDMLKAAKDDLESAVTYEGGVLRVAGVQVLKATWLTANKYFIGDWSRINKINTEGLSLEFSDVEGTNFIKNAITARIESQTALAVEQPLAIVFGDFTAV